MFRDRRAAESPAVFWATVCLLVVIVATTNITVWLIMEVRKEQRALNSIVQGGVREDIERLGTLPGELRWQLFLTVLVLVVLMAAACVLAWFAQAYLKNRAALRDIKILAGDILASMDQGVITTDRAGMVTSVNPSVQELLGLSAESERRLLEEVCGDSLPLVAASNEVLRSGRPIRDLDFAVHRQGHLLRLRADCHVLHDKDHEVMGTVLHIRDVTESALIEERMRRMERFLGLGTLAAGLHHEIKNPLSALSLHVQLLEERLDGQADQDVAENLNVLKTEVTRINRVLESFRDYASFDKLNRADTDIVGLIRQIIELVRPQAQQQNVQIQSDLPAAGLPPFQADAARLEQVVLNLVVNALEEMRGGGTLSVSARRDENGQVVVAVGDTGRGIPDNVSSRIFDPYFTTKTGGSGMGLAFCDKIIRQHGGQLDVQTGPSGTVFQFGLPLDT
jgi:PAS domain S-box-containing protein